MLQLDWDFLGVFATVTESSLVLSPDFLSKDSEAIREELNIESFYAGNLGGSSAVGAVTVGNSTGIIVSREVSNRTIQKLKDKTGVQVTKIPSKLNAVGNLILVNDEAGIVASTFSDDTIERIEKTLGVEINRGTIAGLDTVGSVAVATNRGVLVHPESTEREIQKLKDIFGVSIYTGTVNYGSPFVGNSLLANTSGYVVGKETTGPELGRIEEALYQ